MTATTIANVICSVYLSTSTTGRAIKFSGGGVDVLGTYSISSGESLSRNSTDGGHDATYGAIDGYLERMSVFGPNYVASGSESLRSVTTDDFGEDYKYKYQRDYSDATGLGPNPLMLGVSALRGMNDLSMSAKSRSDWLLPSATNISDTGWVTNNPVVFSEMASTGGLVGVYASTRDIMGGGENGFVNSVIDELNDLIGMNYYSRADESGGFNSTGFKFSTFYQYTQAVFGDTGEYYQTGDSIWASGLRGRYVLPLLDGKMSRLNPVKKWTKKTEIDYKGLTAEILTGMVNFSSTEYGFTSVDKFMSFSDGSVSPCDTNETTFSVVENGAITLNYRFPGYYIKASIVPTYRWYNIVPEMDVSTNVTGYVDLTEGVISKDSIIFKAVYDGKRIGYVTLRHHGDAVGEIYGVFTLARERHEESLSDLETFADESEIAKSRKIYSHKSVEAFLPVTESHRIMDSEGVDQLIETNRYFRARSYDAQSEVKSQSVRAVMDGVAFLQGRKLEIERQAGELPTVTEAELEQMFGVFRDIVGQRNRIFGMVPRIRYDYLRARVADGQIVGYEGKFEGGEWVEDPTPIGASGGFFEGFDDAVRECESQFVPERIEEIELVLKPMIYLMERNFGWWSYKWAPSKQ